MKQIRSIYPRPKPSHCTLIENGESEDVCEIYGSEDDFFVKEYSSGLDVIRIIDASECVLRSL